MSRGMLFSLGGIIMVSFAILAAMFPNIFGAGNDTVELIAYIIGPGGAIVLLFYSVRTQFRRRKKDLKKS